MTTRQLATAQHEAAHAVVGVYLGLPLRAVRVRATAGRPGVGEGYTHFRCTLARRLHLGVMYAAGPAADGIHGRDEPLRWGPDFDEMARLYFSTAETKILIDMATRYLRGPCRRAWAKVTDELLHRDLTGREIKALVAHGERIEE